MGNRLLAPIIIVAFIVVLGGAGFFLYTKGMLPWIGKTKKAVAIKPNQPALQETAKAVQPQEPQKTAAETKPVTAPASPAPQPTPSPVAQPAPKPAPAPAAKPAAKPVAAPTGKPVYSVQAGAFKNENNAAALVKKLKDKGYNAFTSKSVKGKETFYRVLVGKTENRKEAGRLAEDIRSKEKIKVTISRD